MNQRMQQVTNALSTVAHQKICQSLAPEFHKKLAVEVRYFSAGSRFEARSNGAAVRLTLYIHENQENFSSLVSDAAQSVQTIFERRASLRLTTLATLATISPNELTPEQKEAMEEIQEILRRHDAR